MIDAVRSKGLTTYLLEESQQGYYLSIDSIILVSYVLFKHPSISIHFSIPSLLAVYSVSTIETTVGQSLFLSIAMLFLAMLAQVIFYYRAESLWSSSAPKTELPKILTLGRRSISLLGATVALNAVVVLGSFFFIVPGLYFYARLCPLLPKRATATSTGLRSDAKSVASNTYGNVTAILISSALVISLPSLLMITPLFVGGIPSIVSVALLTSLAPLLVSGYFATVHHTFDTHSPDG